MTVVHDVDAYRALSPGGDPEERPGEDGVEVIGLRSRLGPLAPLLVHQTGRPLVHGRRIRRLLEKRNFHVINYHNVSLVGGPGILQAGDALKVYMAHEHWLVCPSHVLWRHGREPCTGRQCLRCVLHHRRPPQLWRYTGYLERQLEHIDVFIAMSEFSREKHHEFDFARNMEVLPAFLPDPEPRSENSDDAVPHARPYFLFAGRLERLKGLDDVIPAFRAQEAADLLIAGAGEYEPVLRKLAAGIPQVRFLGRVPEDRLASYYRHARAVIAPSRGFETFGLVIIEAFRHGTPVIARRAGPFPEIVERARGGELFDTPEELIAAMRRVQFDPAHRRGLSRRAYAAFLEHWTESAVLPRYLEILRAAALSNGRREILQAFEARAPV